MQTMQFAILTSISFVRLFSSPPKVNPTGIEVVQPEEDAERFKLFNSNVSKVKMALKLLRREAGAASTSKLLRDY